MEQLQKASLVLKGVTAIRNDTNTVMTWNNINLRMLLGDMYDKYGNFNLVLNSIGCDDDRFYNSGTNTYTNAAGTDNGERIVTLNMSGLNFLNCTYDSETNNLSSSAVFGTYTFYETFSKNYNGSSSLTFKKMGSDRCTITIELRTVYDNSAPSSLSAYPHMTFLFSIYGIPREKNM